MRSRPRNCSMEKTMIDFSKVNYNGLNEKGLSRNSFTKEQIEQSGVDSGFITMQTGSQISTKQANIIVTVLMTIFAILSIIIAIVSWPKLGYQSLIFPILFGFFVATAMVGIYLSNRNQYKYLKFALDNGFRYQRRDKDIPVGPMMFSIGHSRIVSNSLSIGDDLKISSYQYKIGSGKNEKLVAIEFAKIKLPRKVPHLYLNGKQNYLSADVSNYKTERLKMEGDFDRYFAVYTPPDYQVDILQILTPDVMLALQYFGAKYDYETIGDELYIYTSKGTTLNVPKLQDFFKAISMVENEINKQVKTYSDARAGNVSSGLVDDSGARFKQKRWSIAAGSIGLVIVITVINRTIGSEGEQNPALFFIMVAVIIVAIAAFFINKIRK